MTFTERARLIGFGLFTWMLAMFAAAESTNSLISFCAPLQAGIGAGLFATALLPGRMARFS
jgi:hypothetical protein